MSELPEKTFLGMPPSGKQKKTWVVLSEINAFEICVQNVKTISDFRVRTVRIFDNFFIRGNKPTLSKRYRVFTKPDLT